jgi:hypothetical protein
VFDESPVEISYLTRSSKFVTSVTVNKCRTNLTGYSLRDSPFVKFIQEYQSGVVKEYSGSSLETYYRQKQPRTMAELLGDFDGAFSSFPAMATVMPWWNLTPHQVLKKRVVDINAPKLLGVEAIDFGLKEGGNFGWQYFGPVSKSVGELEFKRLVSVYNSIKEKGYVTHGAVPINGEFLVTQSDWVWVGLGGKHRMSALVALGWDKIPVTTKGRYGAQIVRAAEVDYWPNVRNGLFTKKQALAVFSKISGIDP